MIVFEDQGILQFKMGLCAGISEDDKTLNRGFYIHEMPHGIHYLYNDGVVRSAVNNKDASAFWPTEKEAIDFYEKWKQGQD